MSVSRGSFHHAESSRDSWAFAFNISYARNGEYGGYLWSSGIKLVDNERISWLKNESRCWMNFKSQSSLFYNRYLVHKWAGLTQNLIIKKRGRFSSICIINGYFRAVSWICLLAGGVPRRPVLAELYLRINCCSLHRISESFDEFEMGLNGAAGRCRVYQRAAQLLMGD